MAAVDADASGTLSFDEIEVLMGMLGADRVARQLYLALLRVGSRELCCALCGGGGLQLDGGDGGHSGGGIGVHVEDDHDDDDDDPLASLWRVILRERVAGRRRVKAQAALRASSVIGTSMGARRRATARTACEAAVRAEVARRARAARARCRSRCLSRLRARCSAARAAARARQRRPAAAAPRAASSIARSRCSAAATRARPPRASLRSRAVPFALFHEFVLSARNAAYDPARTRAVADAEMDHPMSDYYVACSHNTYLEADQARDSLPPRAPRSHRRARARAAHSSSARARSIGTSPTFAAAAAAWNSICGTARTASPRFTTGTRSRHASWRATFSTPSPRGRSRPRPFLSSSLSRITSAPRSSA